MPSNITGTETYIDTPGIVLGCWVYFGNAAGAEEYIIGKWSYDAGDRSYLIKRDAAGTITGQVSVDGTTVVSVTSTATPAANTWTHVVLRFVPSATLDIFVDGVPTQLAAGVPASLFESDSAFMIGADGLTTSVRLTGRVSLAFLCAGALTNGMIKSVYHATKNAFGV